MFVGFRVLVFPGVCGGFCIEEEKNGRGALAALASSSSGLVFLWGLMIRNGRNGRGICNRNSSCLGFDGVCVIFFPWCR